MAKNLLWFLVVIAGLSLANPSRAALGWTWDECEQHWGQPQSSATLPNGQFVAKFEPHYLSIIVRLTDGKVCRVSYKGSNEFSASELQTLKNANTISPTATWVFTSKDESTQNYAWDLCEDPTKTDWVATAIFVEKENLFIIFTAADDQRAKAENAQNASDL
jgi:hypothetical protein